MGSLDFNVHAKDGRARSGTLHLCRGKLEFPTVLIYTRRGGALNLTPDMLGTLGPASTNVYTDASQLLTAPPPETSRKHPNGTRGFLAWQDKVVIAAARDSLLELHSRWKNGSDKGVKVDLVSGSLLLSPGRYIDIIEALQPDLYAALGDEVAPTAEPKRIKDSVHRTLRWLDASLREHARRQMQTPTPMAAIQGASSAELRQHSAKESAKRLVSGFTLCGFGVGEPAEARSELLKAATDCLPEHLPRLLPGAYSPTEILQAVECGVDLFDSSYAVKAAGEGSALCLSSDPGIADALVAAQSMPVSSAPMGVRQQVPGERPSKRVIHGRSGKAKAMKMSAHESAAAQARECEQSGATLAGHARESRDEQQGVHAQQTDATETSAAPVTAAQSLSRAGGDLASGTADAASSHRAKQAELATALDAPAASRAAEPAFDGHHMNLWSGVYRLDKRPFVEGCSCMACRQHTRAYVHHLLNTEEMLAKVLLEIHNTHEYMQLLARVRRAIAVGSLAQLHSEISDRRQ